MTPATPDNEMSSTAPNVSAIKTPETPHTAASSRGPASLFVPSGWQPSLRGASRVLLLLLVFLTGCGGGTNFDGGGFPVGRSATFKGRAIAADNPYNVLSQATITLLVRTDPASKPVTVQVTTGQDGTFDAGTLPTGTVNASVQATIQPKDPNFQTEQLNFLINNGHSYTLVASLPPASADLSQAASLKLAPTATTVRPERTIQLNAQILDKNGKPLPYLPSLLADGDFGKINADGSFYTTADGTTTVTALWYNGLHSETVAVKIDSSLIDTPQPPPPPKLPDTVGKAYGN